MTTTAIRTAHAPKKENNKEMALEAEEDLSTETIVNSIEEEVVVVIAQEVATAITVETQVISPENAQNQEKSAKEDQSYAITAKGKDILLVIAINQEKKDLKDFATNGKKEVALMVILVDLVMKENQEATQIQEVMTAEVVTVVVMAAVMVAKEEA